MSFARLHPAFFVGLSLFIAAAPGHAFFEKGEKSEPPRLCVVNKLDASGCKPGDNIYFNSIAAGVPFLQVGEECGARV